MSGITKSEVTFNEWKGAFAFMARLDVPRICFGCQHIGPIGSLACLMEVTEAERRAITTAWNYAKDETPAVKICPLFVSI